jgi:hypothetical protein
MFSYSKDREPLVSWPCSVRGILWCHIRVGTHSPFRVMVRDAKESFESTNPVWRHAHERGLQRSDQNIPINPIASIETRISSKALTRCGAESSITEYSSRPGTRRRLSGWSSKIRTRRILFGAPVVDSRELTCVTRKIFLARMPGCSRAETVEVGFGR